MAVQSSYNTSRMSTPSQEPPPLSFSGTSPASSYGGAATVQDDSFEQYISFDDGVAADPQDPFYTYLANDASLSTELSTSFTETGGDLSHGQLLFHPAQPVHKEHSILAGKPIGQRNHQTVGHHRFGRTSSRNLEAQLHGQGFNQLQAIPMTPHRDCNTHHQLSPRCSPCTAALPQDAEMFQSSPPAPSTTPRTLGRSMQPLALAAPGPPAHSQSNSAAGLQAPKPMGAHGPHCYGTLSPSHPALPQVKPNQHHPVYLHMSSMDETCVDPAELTSSGHNSSDESTTSQRTLPGTPANTPRATAPGRCHTGSNIGNAPDFADSVLAVKSSEPWPYPLPGVEVPAPFPSHASASDRIQTAAGGPYNRLPPSAHAAAAGTTSLAQTFDSRFPGYHGGCGHDLPEGWACVQEHVPAVPGRRSHATSGHGRHHQCTSASSGGARHQAPSRHRSTLRVSGGMHPAPRAPAGRSDATAASKRQRRGHRPTGPLHRHSSSAAAAATTIGNTPPQQQQQQQEASSPSLSLKAPPTSPPPAAAATAASSGIKFVNYTPEDGRRLMAGVAPSGSSKTRARRDREAEEQKQQLLSEAYRQAALAVGLHHHHHHPSSASSAAMY